MRVGGALVVFHGGSAGGSLLQETVRRPNHDVAVIFLGKRGALRA